MSREHQPVFGDVFYLILRRMRFPLLLVIGVYAFCATGLSLIPGTDANGDPTDPMTLFEAFYVVSYTATTIGFGEVPGPYNTAQRLWMTMTMYVSVASWTYSLFAIIALLQDRAFQNAVRMARFSQRVQQLREPFYIVCGTGETGTLVCHGLDHLGLRFVAIELDATRVQNFRMDEFAIDPLVVGADASEPRILRDAGLCSRFCRGVVALTDDDATNQAIAVTVRLLAPRVPVLARIRNAETETHIGVFGGDVVINPFERFAEHLAGAIAAPDRYRLRELLTGLPGEPLAAIERPPAGHWVMCGYGRFGHAVTQELRAAGMDIAIIDQLHYEEGGVDVNGTGTNSEDLLAAGLDRAVGLVTGNSSDTKNLAIAVTARALRHDLYVINRQNQLVNTPLFEAFHQNLLMVPSRIVAQEFLARITTPMLNRFLKLIPQHSEADCTRIYDRLAQLNPGCHPELWDLGIVSEHAPAVTDLVVRGGRFTVGHLRADPFDRSRRLSVLVLFIRRGNRNIQLPSDEFVLKEDDRVLLAGSPEAKRRLDLTLSNVNHLAYVMTGQESNGGYLWRVLGRRRRANPVTPLPSPEARHGDEAGPDGWGVDGDVGGTTESLDWEDCKPKKPVKKKPAVPPEVAVPDAAVDAGPQQRMLTGKPSPRELGPGGPGERRPDDDPCDEPDATPGSWSGS